MSNITWIKGQNSSGKTLRIKQMLGAEIKCDSSNMPKYDITMPKHILFHHNASQVYVFIEKEKALWREYNKIFRLYDRFVTQSNAIAKQEERIREVESKIKKTIEDNDRIQRQYNEKIQLLQDKIKEKNRLRAEIDIIYANSVYSKHQELLSVWCKEHDIDPNSERSKTTWIEHKWFDEKNQLVLEPLEKKLQELCDENRKFMWSNEEFDLEKEKNNPPQLYDTYRDEWALESLVKHLGRLKRNQVNENEILALIKVCPSKKTVWIDGKPSSNFSDFYDLIMRVKELSPDRLFISHCGDDRWFKALSHTLYTLSSGKKTVLDLIEIFGSIFIEVPSMDEKVVVENENI